ncbi:MAG: helix-turn-helix domain-containing protein [Marinilabiliaceae bacterium]|nr:helix-turn-helix domain-containing protein [Marinilabiliaceae bacterium]
MSKTVLIVDEQLFNKLMGKIEKLTEKVDNIGLSGNDGFKDKWYVTDEVCRILKVSRRTLQKMRDTGAIKFTKASKKIYYKASDIELFLEQF